MPEDMNDPEIYSIKLNDHSKLFDCIQKTTMSSECTKVVEVTAKVINVLKTWHELEQIYYPENDPNKNIYDLVIFVAEKMKAGEIKVNPIVSDADRKKFEKDMAKDSSFLELYNQWQERKLKG